ncbi:MAG: tetratricopeptide repeat protein [Isosphaeraceae bacterium]|nr:tetratricopeptide repeat protein [Isosphaeraceae bacterium]
MAADRDILLGLLALQSGLVDEDRLDEALRAWTRDKSRGPAAHLLEGDDFSDDARRALETLVDRHLFKHGGEFGRILASIPAGEAGRQWMSAIRQPEDDATVALERSDSTATVASSGAAVDHGYSLGTAAAPGVRFQVLRAHARGGLGAVYVARDGELNREVALKRILDHHADDQASRRRFLLEAEITGGLEHPGIVPVYGMGTGDDGRPYYAMRFIRGETLKTAIDAFHDDSAKRLDASRRSLELRKLLHKFLDVCNTIDYAHSRGVLHRDIKPANIIVGKHGETLVVDWGLAKANGVGEDLEPGEERPLIPSTSGGSAETLPGSALGTPAFMSPEQARGDLESMGPRSDVYSLGATLYAILVGRAPFEGSDIALVLRDVQRGGFAPPRRVDPSIDAPLAAVCLRAMALEPEDRYPTARALADDVERRLADEPVSAYSEPWTRTLTRWLTRHRTAVAATAAAVLAAFVGLVLVAVVQMQGRAALAAKNGDLLEANLRITRANARVEDARARTQARYELAVEAIKTFHTGVSEDLLLGEDQFKDLRNRLLKSAASFYDRLGDLLEADDDPVARRSLLETNFELAELTKRVGRTEDALAMHERVLLDRELLASSSRDQEPGVDVGSSRVAVAMILSGIGRNEEALAAYRSAENALIGPSAKSERACMALARCRTDLAVLLWSTGRLDEALAALRLARAELEPRAKAADAPLEVLYDLSTTLTRIGIILKIQGKSEAAEAEYRAALELDRRILERAPDQPRYRNGLAASHSNLGLVLSSKGDLAGAEAEFRKALSIRKSLIEAYPAVSVFRLGLANAHEDLGAFLAFERRDRSRGKVELRESIKAWERLIVEHPRVLDHREGLARTRAALGGVLWGDGDLAQAEAELRASIAISEGLAVENPSVPGYRSSEAFQRRNLSTLLVQRGRRREAESVLSKSIDALRSLARTYPDRAEYRESLMDALSRLGGLRDASGDPPAAAIAYRESLELRRGLLEANPLSPRMLSESGGAHTKLGDVLERAGKPADSADEFRGAIESYERLLERETTRVETRAELALARANLARVAAYAGRWDEAESESRRALADYEKLASEFPDAIAHRRRIATTSTDRAAVLRRLGRSDEARAASERAVGVAEALVAESPKSGLDRITLVRSLRERARSLRSRDAAAVDLERALAILDGIEQRSGEVWFEIACCRAMLASERSEPGNVDETLVDSAMDALRAAVRQGYRSPLPFEREPALEILRGRREFALLMMDRVFPVDPFTR